MASKSLFKSFVGKLMPKTDAVNEAGGVAYAMGPQHTLAQYAVTGCLNSTFYASADMQLATVLDFVNKVEPEFIARTAIYARRSGYMKDLPALLVAVLSAYAPGLFAEVFDRVIDDPKMLRNFVQIVRSGVVGRKSLGTLPKRMVQQWLDARTDEQLFRGSVGNDPSLADVIKMVHPKPKTASRAALYAYLIGRPHDASALPEIVKQFEAFKRGETKDVPNVPFQMLTGIEIGNDVWKRIAEDAGWQMTRMNLNTFARHDVFKDGTLTRQIADRLRNPELIEKARVFPYQLMMAFKQIAGSVPGTISDALQDAMEIAIRNVPQIAGQVYVFPDVSGSMSSPATGHRQGATTAVRCIDVAALVAAAMVRKNPSARIIPFEQDVVAPEKVRLNPRDSVMTNANKLASIGGGGTNCSAPLELLNREGASGDLIIYVSDNESWVDSNRYGRGTETMRQWSIFKSRNPAAKLVCIDIQPYGTTQAKEQSDILNVGGFSDNVFDVIALFAKGELGADHWVGVIEQVSL